MKELFIILLLLFQGCAAHRTSRAPMSTSKGKILWRLNVIDETSAEEMNYTIPDTKFRLRILDKYYCKFNSTINKENLISKSITCDVAGTEIGTTTYCRYGDQEATYATLFFKNTYDNVRLVFSCQFLN